MDDEFEDAPETIIGSLIDLPDLSEFSMHEGIEEDDEAQSAFRTTSEPQDSDTKKELPPSPLHSPKAEENGYDLLPDTSSQLRRTLHSLWGPRHILLKDKLSFLLGCTMLWGCAYWLGRSPQTFYKLYTMLGAVMFAVRFFVYRRKRKHYYLFDFCYWANMLLLIHLWILPHWMPLSKATFAFNTGPLTWSILAFRNSLVFHDLDKVTSLFLHLVPALVSWSLRWHPEAPRRQDQACSRTSMLQTAGAPATADGDVRGELYGLVMVPMALYILWALMYYLQIFVFDAKKIQQRGYQTLFKYVTSQKRGVFHAISKQVPVRLQPQAYLFLHLCFCLCTLLLAVPCWHIPMMHTGLLIAVASTAIWAGASYYFEIFASRYHLVIAEVVKQVETSRRADIANPLSSN